MKSKHFLLKPHNSQRLSPKIYKNLSREMSSWNKINKQTKKNCEKFSKKFFNQNGKNFFKRRQEKYDLKKMLKKTSCSSQVEIKDLKHLKC